VTHRQEGETLLRAAQESLPVRPPEPIAIFDWMI